MINEHNVIEIHQGKRILSQPPDDTSSCASYFCLSLSSLSFYFLSLLLSSSSVGLPGILMIHA